MRHLQRELAGTRLVHLLPHGEELRDAHLQLELAAHASLELDPIDPALGLAIKCLEGVHTVLHSAHVQCVADAAEDKLKEARLPHLRCQAARGKEANQCSRR